MNAEILKLSGNNLIVYMDYKKKYFDLLKQKERTFITKEEDWVEDNFDDGIGHVDLAPMTKSD